MPRAGLTRTVVVEAAARSGSLNTAPMAALTRIAFSNASRVSTLLSFRSSQTMSTMRMPDIWAST